MTEAAHTDELRVQHFGLNGWTVLRGRFAVTRNFRTEAEALAAKAELESRG